MRKKYRQNKLSDKTNKPTRPSRLRKQGKKLLKPQTKYKTRVFVPSTTFPTKVTREAKVIEAEASATIETEAKNRKDFRNVLTFTIDPVDAKDYDDAISYRPLDNGYHEVGIHIADVSFYVKPGSALDEEAAKRATSIYMVDKVVPMLPEELSNNICSLKEGVDRLTYSVVFEINEKGEIRKEWFGRTIINSNKRMSYDDAQEIIEQASQNSTLLRETQPRGIVQAILTLNKIALALRVKKAAAGAIAFEEDEIKFELDDKGWPIRVYRKKLKDANKLIEDFMLLANRKVAEFVSKINKNKNKTFIYRVHDKPDMEKITALADFLRPLGYHLKTTGNQISQHEINRLLAEIDGRAEEEMISKLAIRAMAKAVYSMNNIGHYGLAFSHYTHFTSPIRRYPDIIAHRLLDTYLNHKKPSAELLDFYSTQAIHSTEMEIQAAEMERDSQKAFQVKYLSNRVGDEFNGIISGITDFGIFVEELETKTDGLVAARNLKDDYYYFDEKNYALVGKNKGKRLRLGDEVKVKLSKVDMERNLIDWELVT